MMYKNHLLVSNAVAIPIMGFTDSLTVSSVVALSLGALLPDIDEPESFIGRRTRGLSDLLKIVFGHRGITHSLVFIVFVGLLIIPTASKIGFVSFGIWFTVGVFLHIFEDSFSNGGVNWLLPISEKTYHLPIYSTGSLIEFMIGMVALVWLVIGFKHQYFELKHDEVINIATMKNLLVEVKNMLSKVLLE
ncbi:metal-dependent hydrolase [Candidatus Enterococcus courvalinii]|uniref:Metal-dependent hydrolase n=1 Tax=Candidatus Enterococcus courvalinii TaxID=2815329 RepID=A0ABS3HYL5_9ENTE|nr:metal-dependent hydrolase [Enterococcus sp. MSG2901]MBO0481521.1 metal-dependent hydrolase [Enterococcus sp. MSG2901]